MKAEKEDRDFDEEGTRQKILEKGLQYFLQNMSLDDKERNKALSSEAIERALRKEGYPAKLGEGVSAAMQKIALNE